MELFLDRPLTQLERNKLHPNELEVIQCYERTTKNTFLRSEVILVKKLIRVATPKQINAIIFRMYNMYPQNFKDFFYVVQPVERMMKNRRGKKKGEPTHDES